MREGRRRGVLGFGWCRLSPYASMLFAWNCLEGESEDGEVLGGGWMDGADNFRWGDGRPSLWGATAVTNGKKISFFCGWGG